MESLKIQRKSAADLVCDKMKELIVNEAWKAGEKIPTEMELSQIFGVNRLTVRVGLQRLNTLGLLDIRVGDGTYVKQFDLKKQISELAEFYVKDETIQNVSEYRIMLELGCVDMILDRGTEEEIVLFEKLTRRFAEELHQYYQQQDAKTAEEFFLKTVDTSLDLHTALIEMTHNDLIKYAFALAKEPMRRHMEYNASKRIEDLDADFCNIWSKRWVRLAEALRKSDGETVKELLKQIIMS